MTIGAETRKDHVTKHMYWCVSWMVAGAGGLPGGPGFLNYNTCPQVPTESVEGFNT